MTKTFWPNATAAPIGPELRTIRQHLGWSLNQVEYKSEGRFKGVVVGSWERKDRHPTVEQVRELLDFYGGYRLPIVGPDDVIHPVNADDSGAETKWLVYIPLRGQINCADRAEAERIADGIPFARVGYQLISPRIYVDGAS